MTPKVRTNMRPSLKKPPVARPFGHCDSLWLMASLMPAGLMALCVHMQSPSHISNLAEREKSILCRGAHSLETICLLLALKIEHPRNVHLIRGNHEASDINALFGFRIECIERLGDPNGIWAWQRLNALFNWLPLAATIEEKVLCMHGGETPQTAKSHPCCSLQRSMTSSSP